MSVLASMQNISQITIFGAILTVGSGCYTQCLVDWPKARQVVDPDPEAFWAPQYDVVVDARRHMPVARSHFAWMTPACQVAREARSIYWRETKSIYLTHTTIK